MSEPKYRDWILETIDSLRSRKARPDLERICRMVRRRHGSDPDRTRAELEKLIQEQTVLKVSYKGSISYRNAAKVQRKSRKKSELTPDRSSGSGESLGEQAKHATFNNNGDSAHSLTDQEEFGDKDPDSTEARQNLDPHPPAQAQAPAPVTVSEKSETVLPQTSGNSCVSCGATDCTVGSGCGVKASAPKDKRLMPQAGGNCNSADCSKDMKKDDVCDAASQHNTKSTAAAREETHSPSREDNGDKAKKTCTSASSSSSSGGGGGDVGNNNHLSRKLQPTLKPKLRAAVGPTKGPSEGEASDQASADLGDRLVESVRSLTERSRASAATPRAPTPLGLKEILGYLSTQSGLGEEKLTRSRVKAVLEREVARGRLRRTHLGHIALPTRGMGAAKPSARLLKSALQDRQLAKKVEPKREEQTMEVDSKVKAQKKDDKEEEKKEKEKEREVKSERKAEGDEQVPQAKVKGHADATVAKAVPPPSSPTTTPTPTPATLNHTVKTEAQLSDEVVEQSVSQVEEEEKMDTTDQQPPDTQDPVVMVSDAPCLTSSVASKSCSDCKMEVGVSSCLLTPTASPRDLGPSEERGMNGGAFVKVESGSMNPVEWTVADVVNYFTSVGFPEQALAFRTQEIDGKSLLLMQRNDVLTGLSIRLGPALKIYERHVKVLQKTHFQDEGAFC
ncbi:atherin [Alosa sapidissima]|uniref:atherin n=1 Tax=Alosa sapidissima TaxID=34773 RepID=UPI001C0A0D50|nr:atherin [Alosa sapidissima]